MIETGGLNFENLRRINATFAVNFNPEDLSRGTAEERIKKIAHHFESMLLQTLLKSLENESDNSEKIPASGSFSELRLMFLNQYISENGGLGYWKLIEEQILEKYRQQKPEKSENEFHVGFKSNSKKDFQLQMPVEGELSSAFGWRKDPFDQTLRYHKGIDIAVSEGKPVRAAAPGKVVFSGWKDHYGYLIEIEHANGLMTRYGHNSKLVVREGQQVAAGEIISLAGSTGRSTGPHLHFEVCQRGEAVNPLIFLSQLAVNGSSNSAERYNGNP